MTAARQTDVAEAALYRVVPLTNAGGTGGVCQVQQLEAVPGGQAVVVRVWPGDAAHLALWNTLMERETDWGNGSGSDADQDRPEAGGEPGDGS